MTTHTARDIFVDGLRNAHAMERQALEMMERQAERLTDYPDMQAQMERHRGETQQQIARLEQTLSSLGESHSGFKDMAMSAMGNMAAMSHAMAEDEVLKNTFANAAFENYEIAAYTSLLTMAERAGVGDTNGLRQSLQEEIRMAEWVEDNVRNITMQYLAKEEAEDEDRSGTRGTPAGV